jgi:hypothetical protein
MRYNGLQPDEECNSSRLRTIGKIEFLHEKKITGETIESRLMKS